MVVRGQRRKMRSEEEGEPVETRGGGEGSEEEGEPVETSGGGEGSKEEGEPVETCGGGEGSEKGEEPVEPESDHGNNDCSSPTLIYGAVSSVSDWLFRRWM